MKKIFSIVITALFMFFIFSLILIYGDNKVVSAQDENSIFNLEADGYWKPSDIKSHDFIIRNGFGEVCYLDSLSFSESEINDVESEKSYTLDEADKAGIIDAYNVILSLNDNKYGNSVLYDGKLKDLDNDDIKLSSGLYMNIGQEIKFTIKISMDAKAGNEYQNKHYVFTIYPKCHKLIYVNDNNEGLRDDTEHGYYDEDGRFHKGHKDEDGNWVDEGFYDTNGDWVDYGYYDENGNWHDYGYIDYDGDFVIDGYYDKDGNWHNGYYYDKYGVKHDQNSFSNGVNRVNKYFKTGQGMVAIMGYEIMFITCCFFIMYRIRQKQNVL